VCNLAVCLNNPLVVSVTLETVRSRHGQCLNGVNEWYRTVQRGVPAYEWTTIYSLLVTMVSITDNQVLDTPAQVFLVYAFNAAEEEVLFSARYLDTITGFLYIR